MTVSKTTKEESQFVKTATALALVANNFRACLNTLVNFQSAVEKWVPDPNIFSKVREIILTQYPPEVQQESLQAVNSREELYNKIISLSIDPKVLELLESITALDDKIYKQDMASRNARDTNLN